MEPITANSCDNCTENDNAFEQRFSTRSLRMLKLITPYFPVSIQPSIALMIRMQELMLLLHNRKASNTPAFSMLFSAENHSGNSSVPDQHPFSPEFMNQLLQKISPLLLPEERSMIDRIRQMMQMFETYKQLEPYMSMFSQMNDMSDNDKAPSPDGLMGMLSPDLMQNLGPLMQAFTHGDDTSAASDDASEHHRNKETINE